MNNALKTGACAAILMTMLTARAWAEDAKEERSIDSNVSKIVLDGSLDLQVKRGANAGLVIYGEQSKFSTIQTSISGEVLHISGAGGIHILGTHKNARAELTLPELKEVISGGVGSVNINGFTGDKLHLVLAGAGDVNVNGSYKQVEANLSGIGNFNIDAGDSDKLDFRISGAGDIKVHGLSRNLSASLSGVGNMDAKQLQADNVNVRLSGFGNVSVFAKQSVNVKLSGLGNADVYGQPASRDVQSSGMGKVSWK